MARPKKKTENEVIKASAAIHIEGKITLLQRRAWNVLLAHAYDELPHKTRHVVRIPDLMRDLAYNSGDQEYLKEVLEALVGCKVKWNILEKDGAMEWGVAALLAGAKISQGVCVYEYGSLLREKLYHPHMYARLSLLVQNRFESKHALTLWELCVDYLGAKRECGETPWLDIETFRKLMGLEDSQYYATLFKKLRQKVITPALEEINAVSDFRVTVEFRQRGRKVIALKFKICRVAPLPDADPAQAPLFSEWDERPALVHELQAAGLSTHDALAIWQQGFQGVEPAVRPASTGTDPDAAFAQYVREKIHLLQQRRAAGKVEHATGFLLQAIRHNYTNGALDSARQQAHQRAQAQELARLLAEQAQLHQDRETAAQKVCAQLAAEAPTVLEQAVTMLLAEDDGFRYLYDRHKTPLVNYRERLAIRAQLIPALLQHAPAQVQGAMAAYTTRLAALDARLATLQGVNARATS